MEESKMAPEIVYSIIGLAIILAIIIIILVCSNSKTKGMLEETTAALDQNLSRLKKADFLYRESVQARENLSQIHEELKERYERVNRLAYTDALTELPNRQQFTEILEGVMLTLRSGENVALSYFEFGDLAQRSNNLTRS